jgi:hypothetical protein
MLSRVVRPDTTTYLHDYGPKRGLSERSRNWSVAVSTGTSYCPTRRSLYQTDYHDTAERGIFTRPRSFKMDLLELPPEYRSSVTPNLSPTTGITDYQHYYGKLGERATFKST